MCPSPPPISFRLSKNAYSSLHTITCTGHWVGFDFFPSGLIKRRGIKRKIEKSYFYLKAVQFRSISVYRGKGYKGKEEIRTIYLFFFFHRIFWFSSFQFKVILLYIFFLFPIIHSNMTIMVPCVASIWFNF